FEKHDDIKVVHSLNGSEALLALEGMLQENCLPCLIILDINMPVMNGREALQAIRNNPHFSKLKVVLFSTSDSPSDVAFAKSFDASLITKPIEYANLEMIAKAFVDQCNFEINKLSAN
ncbi:MAG: response regulator, partial [Flavisolibacter sp.]|nr:response regulator [Flavisolibacter sp.]